MIKKIIISFFVFLSLFNFVSADFSSTWSSVFSELPFSWIYNNQSDILELPTFSWAKLEFDYSNKLNDVNINLYEIKYILIFMLSFFIIFNSYFLINSLLWKK